MAAVFITIVALAGCAQDSLPSVRPSIPAGVPTVRDDAGVVNQASFEFSVDQPAGFEGILLDSGAVVRSPSEGWDARIGWAALPCQTAPVITFARDGENLVATIDPGPEIASGDTPCESMEAHHYVDVDLNGVTADEVAVLVAGD